MVTIDPCDPVFKVFVVRTLQPDGAGCRRTAEEIFMHYSSNQKGVNKFSPLSWM